MNLRIRFYRNKATGVRWAIEKLPIRQKLIWAGPVFILVQRGPR